MSVFRRIAGNSGANALGIGLQAVLQIVSVPVLTASWGTVQYGVWLMLSTIPTYLNLSDLGFGSAAIADMTMAHARDERAQVVRTYHSLLLMALAIAAGAALIASPFALLAAAAAARPAWWPDHSGAIAGVIMFSGLSLLTRAQICAFVSTGFYARGTSLTQILSFLETALMLSGAHFAGWDMTRCIAFMVVFRLGSLATVGIVLRRSIAWLPGGVSQASLAEFKRLWGPAIASMAMPLTLSLNLQGMILIAGSVVSPVAAATLGPVRTIGRIAIQAVGIVNRATLPEWSAAQARGDRGLVRRLIRVNVAMVAFMLVPGAIVLAAIGTILVALWTGGRIVPGHLLMALIAADLPIHGMWYFGANLLVAVNRHTRFARLLLPISIVTAGVAVATGKTMGLEGIALAILLGDLACLIAFLRGIDRRHWRGASFLGAA